ncbi:unnamed protein product [Rotaria magnacalcarata]|uniref:Uncharacterized protein n=1 Tax=Rotaria magnacalcarata TaxID=392030 RepID=A0A814QW80_9BILA|nr:unnamed protein product [Rotaria magnacalcarata]CAF4076334.1 unnamed protein product [Rotaria magnacalcarata]
MTQKLQREYQRAQCVALSDAGLSCREASNPETGAFHDRRRSGRPKKLNDRNVCMLKRLTENDGRYSSRERTSKLNNSLKNHDETTFYVIKRKNKVKIWRTKDEQWKEGCMEVAAIGGGGGGRTVIYVIPTVHLYQTENDLFYQHDNARYHVSRQVQTKLHELGVKLLEWPAKSSD